MENKFWHKLLLVGFTINILTVLSLILNFILTVSYPEELISFNNDQSHKTYIHIVYNLLVVPTFLFWIYNIIFLFRHDRYSKSILLLFFFNFLYSPIYFYQVKIRRRPLINEINPEPVIGQTINLEDYESETDFEKDVKSIQNDNQTK
jgi:hypothetical protein